MDPDCTNPAFPRAIPNAMVGITPLLRVHFFGSFLGPRKGLKLGPERDPKRDRKRIPKRVPESWNTETGTRKLELETRSSNSIVELDVELELKPGRQA